MTGVLYRLPDRESKNISGSKVSSCQCGGCPCKPSGTKHVPVSKNGVPPGCVVFQLPKYEVSVTDIYSHSVYKKEYCNKALMKKLTHIAQKKTSQRPHLPPREQLERFNYKTITESDFMRYTLRESAACKAKYPRLKRKEDFYFKPGEYKCDKKFPPQSLSNEDYAARSPIPQAYPRRQKEYNMPPFEGISCYHRDYKAPHPDAYPKQRKAKKRVKFD